MQDLNKIKLGHSPLTDRIFLYRHGKDPDVILDKREAEADVMAVFVTKMMYDSNNRGSTMKVKLGDDTFEVSCKLIEK